MAPNKKKKKAASNPARGFATTSLPSKTKAVEEQDETASATQTVASGHAESKADPELPERKDATSALDPRKQTNIQEMTPQELEDHLETSELESMVDRYAARSIADAGRQVTRLDTERRQLRPQAYKLSTYSWLDEETTDELFASDVPAPFSNGRTSQTSSPQDADEKVLIDLWTLERVIQTLNLPMVPEAVAYVAGLAVSGQLTAANDILPGLAEAFRWYACNTQSGELPNYEQVPEAKAAQSGGSTPQAANSGKSSIRHGP